MSTDRERSPEGRGQWDACQGSDPSSLPYQLPAFLMNSAGSLSCWRRTVRPSRSPSALLVRIHFLHHSLACPIPSLPLPRALELTLSLQTFPQLEKQQVTVGEPSAPACSSEPCLNPYLLFLDQGSPFSQEMLEECRQASPYFPGSYGPGAPSPGSSDVSTAGELPRLDHSLPSPPNAPQLLVPCRRAQAFWEEQEQAG